MVVRMALNSKNNPDWGDPITVSHRSLASENYSRWAIEWHWLSDAVTDGQTDTRTAYTFQIQIY